MKKRIFALALVVGVLLSVCSFAWADDIYYNFGRVEAEYETIYKITSRKNLSFEIRVRAYVNTNTSPTGGYSDAAKLAFTVSQDTNNAISGDLAISPSSDDISNVAENGYIEAKLTGTISGDTAGVVRVTATMLKSDGSALTVANNLETSKYCEVSFTPEDGTEVANGSFLVDGESGLPITDVITATDDMKADPDNEFWDGLDPIFTSDPGTNSNVKGKAKLKTTKISDFKAGTKGTAKIEITGPVTEVDVYIAAKDAAKLWPDSVDKSGDPIRLTKANIKTYSIPFRITEFDDSGNLNKLTGAEKSDKTAFAKDKSTAKSMTTKLTLAFNGAKFAYKGFPLTFSVTNGEMSKAAAKAIKINVTPNTNEPGIYRYEDVESTTAEVSLDVTSGDILGTVASDGKTITSKDYGDGSLHALVSDVYGSGYTTFTFTKISGDTYTSGDEVIASGDANLAAYYTYTYTAPQLVAYNKKAKPKQDWDIAVPLTAETEDEVGDVDLTNDPREFYISGDAILPYVITVKGPSEKNGVEAEIHQPQYDSMGNIIEEGYVVIGGKLENTTKESKTGVTITATNPSTKKKGSVKINVIGKVPATFDKSKFVDAPDAADYTDDYDKGAYGTVVNTKNVEAGKVPSVSFKAKGSKTIAYTVEYGEDELTAAGLSFDAKKGKIIALSTKDKVVPTVDDDGNFSPADILVYAYNGIEYLGEDGADVARALIGITGAKPSVADKSVTFAKSDQVSGDYIKYADDPFNTKTFKTFKLNAGKQKPASPSYTAANVKATTEYDLSEMGLELVSWESMDKMASKDKWFGETDTIFESGDLESADFVLYSSDLTTKLDTSVWTTVDDSGNRVFTDDAATSMDAVAYADDEDGDYEGKLKVEYGNVKVTGNEAYRNYGIIRIVDPTKMEANGKGVKLDLALTNIGAEGKGKLTVVISETNSSLKQASARNTVSVKADKAARNGKGGGAGSDYAAYGDEGKAEELGENAEEAVVTVGAPRTAADLTAAQKAFLEAKGYTVIAVLPEISATADGQQDFEVELDEDAPEGEKMIYIPFPQDVEETEDDSIVDFYDEAGAAIEEVPAGKAIVAAPWLRADVVYQPVIAVEAGK
ncbi:MAG: hypothetical protein IJS28_03480 [Synergistaceae bacterium]|nr:hypothetical protein [Synergistaceae bacterium]